MNRFQWCVTVSVAITLAYIFSLPIILLVENQRNADFGFNIIFLSSYGDAGRPQGTVLMANPYHQIYKPILKSSVDSKGDLTPIGHVFFGFSHTHREEVTFDDNYEEALLEAIALTKQTDRGFKSEVQRQ